VANYVNGVRTGNLIFLAGKGPKYPDGHELHGKLDAEVTIEQGYDGARMTAINQMAVLKSMLGNLNKVVRIVKVFGERGRHARAAVGMASLPRGQSVEIEMIVEVSD
jgi:enamine deaminase RidA (YjgF/YER057c/UK114 family)